MMVISVEALLDWIMDSGGSYHITPKLDLFFDCDGGRVLLGNNMECKIKGIVKVKVQLKDGSSFVLHNVKNIPELKINLISLGTLEIKGYIVKLQSGKIKVINGSRVILSGTRRDNCVYSLDGHVVAGELNAIVEEKDSLAQFQCRNAHYSGSDRLCSFRLMGPSQVESLGAFGKFKEWKHLVENHIGRMVKKMRTDNGLELCNQEFEQLCTESGIARHLTVFSLKDCMSRDRDVERMSKVPYTNLVRGLMYLMVCTRLDITYAGNANVGLVYGTDRGNHVDVTGFVDSDYAKDTDKVRSISGYTILVHGCVVSWKAKLQHVMALSTTKAESIALAEAVKVAIWLRGLLKELGV
ncbi:retrovirus-related pol polyprotein from transposon TNT 1-94 [Tanacetum coccineum]